MAEHSFGSSIALLLALVGLDDLSADGLRKRRRHSCVRVYVLCLYGVSHRPCGMSDCVGAFTLEVGESREQRAERNRE